MRWVQRSGVILAWFAMAAGSVGACADEVVYFYEGDIPPYPDAGWWWGNCVDTCHESLEDGRMEDSMRWVHRSGVILVWSATAAGRSPARADELLHSYDADIVPYADEAGWLRGRTCAGTCQESLEEGHLVLRWDSGRIVSYGYIVGTSQTRTPPPNPPFWVEWAFRSNHLLGNNPGCDGLFLLQYVDFIDHVAMYADAAVSSDGGSVMRGLPVQEFTTYRFESADGQSGCFFVNGRPFFCRNGSGGTGTSAIQMVGLGGCDLSQPPTVNEWDFVRFGRITYGEQIIASDPPNGLNRVCEITPEPGEFDPYRSGLPDCRPRHFLDARIHALLDRFTVTYEEPNYVYVDEISVTVEAPEAPRHAGFLLPEPRLGTKRNRTTAAREWSGPHGLGDSQSPVDRSSQPLAIPDSPFDVPTVSATRRRDNGPPDEVEIVLDRPIPYNATTRFTFDDGEAINVVEYTFAPGDTDGDGLATLADFARLQNCLGASLDADAPGPCLVLDRNGNDTIDLDDFFQFLPHLSGPNTEP